jgi:DnaJ domain
VRLTFIQTVGNGGALAQAARLWQFILSMVKLLILRSCHMFETQSTQRVLVNLQLADGGKVMANLRLPVSGKVLDLLNNADRFVEILGAAGEHYFLAKEQIVSASIANPPKAGLNLNRRSVDAIQFNAWVVLGVASGSAEEKIKSAYRNLVKTYHPDRFANMDLPPEMKEYAAAMLSRINIAYDHVARASAPR